MDFVPAVNSFVFKRSYRDRKPYKVRVVGTDYGDGKVAVRFSSGDIELVKLEHLYCTWQQALEVGPIREARGEPEPRKERWKCVCDALNLASDRTCWRCKKAKKEAT